MNTKITVLPNKKFKNYVSKARSVFGLKTRKDQKSNMTVSQCEKFAQKIICQKPPIDLHF